MPKMSVFECEKCCAFTTFYNKDLPLVCWRCKALISQAIINEKRAERQEAERQANELFAQDVINICEARN